MKFLKKVIIFSSYCRLHFYGLLPFANLILYQDISKSITARSFKLSQQIEDGD